MSCPKTISEVHTCLLVPGTCSCPKPALSNAACTPLPISRQALTWDLLKYIKPAPLVGFSPLPPWFYITGGGGLNANRTRPATGQRNEAIKKAEFSQGGNGLAG